MMSGPHEGDPGLYVGDEDSETRLGVETDPPSSPWVSPVSDTHGRTLLGSPPRNF